jgi:hypothetical protein
MRAFFCAIGLPLFLLGLAGMTRDVFPSGPDDSSEQLGPTVTGPATSDGGEQPGPTVTSDGEGPDGGSSGPDSLPEPPVTVPTSEPSNDCPPVPADFFRIGEYYRRLSMEGPSFQVVDPAVGGDPDALWIDQYGMPVINPRFPLAPEAMAVSEAFGSPQAAVDFNRCSLRPVARR